ncbi:MAG: hypothetical protein IH846_08945 [Acidobacteria bacterium]|nr:hypothetical protein [Acidobacteriota bacterium]
MIDYLMFSDYPQESSAGHILAGSGRHGNRMGLLREALRNDAEKRH